MKKINDPKGFILPLALAIMGIIFSVTIIVIQSTVQSQRNITKHGYQLIARQAAKAGVDYAKERFEATASYSGTVENRNTPCSAPGTPVGCDVNSTVLYTSSDYKVVFEVTVISTSSDGITKNIKSIGRVYIPEGAGIAAYVQDIKTAIIRRAVVASDPGTLAPVLWYDADDPTTLEKNSVSTSAQTLPITGSVEERTNGSLSTAACSSNDLELGVNGEYSGGQRQTVGMRFTGLNVPRGAKVTNAYIQLTSASTFDNSSINLTVSGVDADNLSAWSCPTSGSPPSSQLGGAAKTSHTVAWNSVAVWAANVAGASQKTPSITNIIQEVVCRGITVATAACPSGYTSSGTWNSGNALGLLIDKSGGGSGTRTAKKGAVCSGCTPSDVSLYVEWEVGSGSFVQAGNGDTVERWKDKSTILGGGRDLTRLSGAPKLRANTLNAKPVVEFFTNGSATKDVLGNTALGTVLTNKTAATIISVMKPTSTSGSSGGNDRYVTLVNSSQINETLGLSTTHALRAFYRSASTTNLTSGANNLTTTPLNGSIGNSFASGAWGIFSNRFSNTAEERFSKNGAPSTTTNGGSNIDYNVNQVYLGATTSAAGTFTNAGDMQVAELIVYDKEISCEQIESIELYLQTKWGVTTDAGNCPTNAPIAY